MEVKPSLLKGSGFAIAAFFCMAIFGVFTKLASTSGSELWISFISYLTGLLVMTPFVLYQGISSLKTYRFPYHLGRATFGLAASFLYMLSMHHIPIVNATLLFNTAPIFIPILATFWLKVRIATKTWLAIALGFLGILVIIKPNMGILDQPGDLLGIASGIFLAVAYLLIKLLSPTDPLKRIIYYFFLISTCIQIPLLVFAGSPPSWESILFAFLGGLSFLFAQLFLVKAYQYAQASEIGVYQYTSVIFVGLIDWGLWGYIPPLSNLFGVLLVFLAALVILRSNK